MEDCIVLIVSCIALILEDLWFNLYQDQGQKKNNEVEAIGDKVYRIRENKMLGLKLEAQRKRRFLRNAPEADSDV
jgi:hypothetical protein